MSELIEKAREKLAELEARAEELRFFLAMAEMLTGDKPVDSVSRPTATGRVEERTASPAEIVESAKRAMRERGRPLTRSEIVKALTDKGLRLPGKDKSKNVGTVIWRSKQFENVEGHGYWPTDFGAWIGQRPLDTPLPFGGNP